MIKNDSSSILFIEPKQPATPPLVDDVTRKMTAAWRARDTSGIGYRGVHDCTGARCLAMSDNRDHYVGPQHLETNSLCIHYVACHRSEVPREMLAAILNWEIEGVEPTDEELGVKALGSGIH